MNVLSTVNAKVVAVVAALALMTLPLAALFATNVSATAPTLSEITAVGESNGGVTNDSTPSYTFSSSEDGLIVYHGPCVDSNTLYATSGSNTVTFDTLADDEYEGGTETECSLFVVDSEGNFSTELSISDFEVDTTAPTVMIDRVYDSSNNDIAGETTDDTTPSFDVTVEEFGSFTGSFQSNLSIDITGTDCDVSATTFTNGGSDPIQEDTFTFNALASGDYDCAIEVEDEAGNTTTVQIPDFSVDSTAPVVTITSDTPDPDVGDSSVEVRVNSTDAGDLTVSAGDCVVRETYIEADTPTDVLVEWLADGDYDGTTNSCTLQVENEFGQTGTADVHSASSPFTIDSNNQIPGISVTSNVPSTVNDTMVEIGINANEAGTIDLVCATGGTLTTDPAVAYTGDNTIMIVDLTDGDTYEDCTLEITDNDSLTSNSVNLNDFEVDDSTGPSLTLVDGPEQTDETDDTVEFTVVPSDSVTATNYATTLKVSGSCGLTDFDAELNADGSVTRDMEYTLELDFSAADAGDGAGNIDDNFTNCSVAIVDNNLNTGPFLSLPDFTVDTMGPDISYNFTGGNVVNPVEVTFSANEPGYFDITGGSCTVDGETEFSFDGTSSTFMIDPLTAGNYSCDFESYDNLDNAGDVITVDVTISDDSDPNVTGVSVNSDTLVLTFNSSESGILEFDNDSYCSSTEYMVMEGTNAVQLNPLPAGLVVSDCSFTVTEYDGTGDDNGVAAEFTVGGPTQYPEGTVFRFLNNNYGSAHFYTISEEQRETVLENSAAGGVWEGIFTEETPTFGAEMYENDTCPTNYMPVYRFRNNVVVGTHFYTISETQKATVETNSAAGGIWEGVFTYEQVAFCAMESDTADTVPVYRFRNESLGGSVHFYTASEQQRQTVLTNIADGGIWEGIFVAEGVAFYAMPFEAN